MAGDTGPRIAAASSWKLNLRIAPVGGRRENRSLFPTTVTLTDLSEPGALFVTPLAALALRPYLE
jgi:hypothetical protein